MSRYNLDEAFEDLFGAPERPLEDTSDVEDMPETKLVNIMVTAERLLSQIQDDTEHPAWVKTKLKTIESELEHIAAHFDMYED